MSEVLKEIESKSCDKCKYVLEGNENVCPNCQGNVFKKMYKRFRKERVIFMIMLCIAVSIIVFTVAANITGKAEPQTLLSGLLVLSLYAAGNFFLGIKFYDYFIEGEIPEEARQEFSKSYFISEFFVFIFVLVGVFIIGTIFWLFDLPRAASR
jgi:predicted nucleic acid-binding Zn ribbon protein